MNIKTEQAQRITQLLKVFKGYTGACTPSLDGVWHRFTLAGEDLVDLGPCGHDHKDDEVPPDCCAADGDKRK